MRWPAERPLQKANTLAGTPLVQELLCRQPKMAYSKANQFGDHQGQVIPLPPLIKEFKHD